MVKIVLPRGGGELATSHLGHRVDTDPDLNFAEHALSIAGGRVTPGEADPSLRTREAKNPASPPGARVLFLVSRSNITHHEPSHRS